MRTDGLILFFAYCEMNGMTEQRKRHTISSKGLKSKRSELPEHGNSSAYAHVVIVEITKPSKG